MIEIDKPFISIITISFNAKSDLKKTIENVNCQTYRNFEHIIIDGNSTDGTKNYLNQLNAHQLKILIESDTGIYDAMNKGLALANGDFILMLNSGDHLVDNTSLEKFVINIIDFDQIYYAKAIVIDEFGNSYSKPNNKTLNLNKIHDFPIHQSILIPKKFISYKYNTNFLIAGDTEYLINVFEKQKPTFINVEFVVFYLGGISSHQKNIKQLYHYIKELNVLIFKYENFNLLYLIHKNLLIIAKFIFLKIFPKKVFYNFIKIFK